MIRFRLALLLLAAWMPSAAGAQTSSDTWYVRKIITGDVPIQLEYYWSSGRRLRMETVVAGVPILTLVNGEYYYVIDRLAGSGVAIRRSKAALAVDRRGGRPFATEGRDTVAKGERLRSDEVLGRACEVYRASDRAGRREGCLIDDEERTPLQIEVFDRSTKRTVLWRYLDWTRGFPIPDDFFAPDPRVKLERLEYEEYVERVGSGPVGPAPVMLGPLLHGR